MNLLKHSRFCGMDFRWKDGYLSGFNKIIFVKKKEKKKSTGFGMT